MVMKYGVDIASARLDDLDKRILSEIKERTERGETVLVLDAGCGQGGLLFAAAAIGAQVVGVDIDDYEEVIKERGAEAKLPPTVTQPLFIQEDICSYLDKNNVPFDIVVLQRVLHYLPYKTAVDLLTKLHNFTDDIYLSVTGMGSAIAKYYNAKATPVENRWGYIDEDGQKLFSISAPLCVYTEMELLKLLKDAGWGVTWSRVSDFGNIKVNARRTLVE